MYLCQLPFRGANLSSRVRLNVRTRLRLRPGVNLEPPLRRNVPALVQVRGAWLTGASVHRLRLMMKAVVCLCV